MERVVHRLFEKLPAAAYACDAEGRISYFSAQAAQIWGREPKLNDPIERFCGSYRMFRPDGTPIPHDECWMARALKQGQEFLGKEIIIERPNGQRRTVLAHVHPFHDDTGKLAGAVNILVDITERKRVEEALRDSEALYASLVESLPVNLFRKDLEGRFTFANQRFCELIGMRLPEVLGKTDFDFYPAALAEAYQRDDRDVLDRGTPLEKVEGHQTPSGEDLHVQVLKAPVRDAQGRIIGLLGVFWDVTQRIRAEQALRESETRLAETQRVAHLGSWELDLVTHRMVWSEEGYRRLGLTPDDVPAGQEGFLTRVHVEDRDAVREALQTAIKDGEELSVEYRVVWPDGSLHWLHSRGKAIYDAEGQPQRFLGISLDITPRKTAEEALRASEAKYRAIFDNAVEGFFQTSPDGAFLNMNPALARIYGWELPEHAVSHFRNVADQLYVDPSRRQEFKRQIDAYGTVKGFEFEIYRKDGSRAWVSESARAVRDKSGQLLYYEGTVEDITERKRNEDVLRQREAFLRMSQQIGRIGSWEWDMTTQRVIWSDEMYRIYGVAQGEFDGTLAAAVNLTHPEDRPAVAEAVQRLLEGGEPTSLEFRIEQPQGDIRHVWGKGDIIRDAVGKPQRMIGIVTDVTERKRAEEERRRLEAQILHAQKLESLGILAGGIAHDFNNLLTAILGYASLARTHLPGGSSAAPMLEEIERGAERAADLAQQMLAYSGKGRFFVRVVALDALVREMTNLLHTVVSKRASLRLELAPAAIEGDGTQIRQVIMNLITNASDALDGLDGAIVVRTGVRRCQGAALRSRYLPGELPEGDYAFLEVQDSGCGMSEETLKRIFDPFFTTKFTGRGLGLAAVLGIVRGHRGTVHVESEVGGGTTFQVLFPCSTRAAVAAASSAPSEPDEPRGDGLILIVEDEDSVRDFVRHVLEGAGFSVVAAAHGREGVDSFRRHRDEVRAVILDMTMPQMDGVEVAQRLRELDSEIPILLMSGYNEHEVSTRFTGAGIAAFLQKPFRNDDLLARVRRHLKPLKR